MRRALLAGSLRSNTPIAFGQTFRAIDGSRTILANFLGWCYAPLILLDQAFVHRTERLYRGK